jgi:hypothetical protein
LAVSALVNLRARTPCKQLLRLRYTFAFKH